MRLTECDPQGVLGSGDGSGRADVEQALGMDTLKKELTGELNMLGFKGGGTLEQRAQRLFSIQVTIK